MAGGSWRGPKHWRFQRQSLWWTFRADLLSERLVDLLADQGALKNLLQHHGSETSILWHSAFFMVELSHPHATTGKTIALTMRTFVSKVMALLFNTLSRWVIGEGNGNPLQCSYLENPRDGGACWAAVYGVAQSQTQLK